MNDRNYSNFEEYIAEVKRLYPEEITPEIEYHLSEEYFKKEIEMQKKLSEEIEGGLSIIKE